MLADHTYESFEDPLMGSGKKMTTKGRQKKGERGGGKGERTRQGGSGLPGSGRERDYGRPVAVMTGALEQPRRPLPRRDRSENYFEGGERAEKLLPSRIPTAGT